MKIAGVVLAGGLSSRMGIDKASLLLTQKTLLKHAQELLLSLNLTDVFISGSYAGYRCISDVHKEMGPIGALYACEQALCYDYDALYVIAVDMPLLNVQTCQAILKKASNSAHGVYSADALFPLFLPLNMPLKEELSRLVDSNDPRQRSLYSLLRTLKVAPISASQEERFYLQNTNTPEQWQRCKTLYSLLKNQRNRNESPEQQ
ncbi:molybdopterin-guanine dinucleotide biosynthesis protein MobA [Psychromonas sp. CNPT3]|uniref:molybdenum cofactor guanylyltransferase n=1 Tax=Psychromonas sp. CNPT3 TaxID=314282 RepID=UPI00006E47FC|nr:molybdenum cofactor guanylyltransferase [Psychromonas sp. CNPT3]AGH81235.1 molybdopterin-guanine dinucleotide biosynthesis protein MobA [Psychromonas sp. CNPT3]